MTFLPRAGVTITRLTPARLGTTLTAHRTIATSSVRQEQDSQTPTATETKPPTTQVSSHEVVHSDVVSGAPTDLRARMVRIFRAAKSAMQSGTANTRAWRIDFDVLEHGDRWENQLMGWASSADYMQAVRMKFKTKESAIEFAEKQGWNYYVQEPKTRAFKKMVYGDNFTYSPTELRLVRTK
ncbi:ndufs4 NADH dehydrogenase Fe-S protein subunit [Dimargaris verticillata]|uniref:NADH dehydrogenase [ubiquinone] iron-sulfur protein 4, mitochondrial n=1 Tax=Dimargaris verticillata TaxID=2761393 RepID=A0A9W8ECU8_9FUNG|nr:ndufs4 NADH dehydrogenase Fe-S protein subunit [Dimargaris verticillata]